MKVLFVNDSTSNPNWGDRAAALSLRMMVSEAGGDIISTITEEDIFYSSLDGHRVDMAGAGSQGSRDVIKLLIPPGLLKLRRRLLKNVDLTAGNLLIPERWEDYGRSLRKVLANNPPWPRLIQSLGETDVVVIHGDGSMVANGIHPRTLLFLSYVSKKCFGKPVIMVNHTTDFDHPDLRRVAEEVYPLFDDVVFRDPISAERSAVLCEGKFAPDTAFWFAPAPRAAWASVAARPSYFDVWPEQSHFDPTQRYLCLGGSSMFGPIRDKRAIVEAYAVLIARLQVAYPGQVVLTASDLVDEAIFGVLSKRLDLPLIGLHIPVAQAVDVLAHADAYIGGRWHPGIFALRGGTPILALSSKTFKMQALADMAGLGAAVFDATDLIEHVDGVVQKLDSCLDQGEELRASIRAWAEEMARASWTNVAYLREMNQAAAVAANDRKADSLA